MELRCGFELLKTRPFGEDGNIDALEEKYGVKLPPKFKLFHQTFETGWDAMFSHKKNVNKIYQDWVLMKNGMYDNCSRYTMQLDKELKYDLFNIADAASVIESYAENRNFSERDRVIPDKYFTVTGAVIGAFIVGSEGEHTDQIFYIDPEMQIFEYVTSDIFTFMKGLILKPISEENLRKYKLADFDQLYKNWGEDFWRIREK